MRNVSASASGFVSDRLLGAADVSAAEAPFQIGHDFAHGLVAIFNLLGDHLSKDGCNLLGNVVTQLAKFGNRLCVMGQQLGGDGLADVSCFAGEQKIKRAAEAVNVGPGVGVLAC